MAFGEKKEQELMFSVSMTMLIYPLMRYKGDERATLSAFSFGAIKHVTAFGGAILRCENAELLQQIREYNDSLPMLSSLQSIKKMTLPIVIYPFINLRFWFYPLFITLQLFGIQPVAVGNCFINEPCMPLCFAILFILLLSFLST